MKTSKPTDLINDTSLLGQRRLAVARVAYEKYNGTSGYKFHLAHPHIQQMWLEHTSAILAALKDPELAQ